MDWIISFVVCVFADGKRFWMKRRDLDYQMAALVWLKGLVIGLLLGAWLL